MSSDQGVSRLSDQGSVQDVSNLPLHVATLSTTQGDNAVFAQNVQRQWVDTLLVNDNETLLVAIANFLFELDNLADLFVGELAFGLDHLLSLVSAVVEEARVDLTTRIKRLAIFTLGPTSFHIPRKRSK